MQIFTNINARIPLKRMEVALISSLKHSNNSNNQVECCQMWATPEAKITSVCCRHHSTSASRMQLCNMLWQSSLHTCYSLTPIGSTSRISPREGDQSPLPAARSVRRNTRTKAKTFIIPSTSIFRILSKAGLMLSRLKLHSRLNISVPKDRNREGRVAQCQSHSRYSRPSRCNNNKS